ncbi:large ribosomal subunit protein uL29m-like [Ptychodera flava]|uniref:large ribosomal subunit protein uL29m-like n=1 Tax=Ptychodera flava TaxID=63121 RepID=UPI00396A83E9
MLSDFNMAASMSTKIASTKINVDKLCRAFSWSVRTNSYPRRNTNAFSTLTCSSQHQLYACNKVTSLASQHPIPYRQKLHTTSICCGLEEFFDEEKNWGEMEVKSGRAWELDELRIKNSADLHKLWYVLLKEKNMLLTMKEEAKKKKTFMPSPERLEKVETSMERLMQVVKERNDAVRELRTGEKEEIPTRMSYNIFGEKIKRQLREWPIPYHMNKKVQNHRHFYYPMTVKYIRMRREIEENYERRRQRKISQAKAFIKRKFPDADID